jgi:hypothetical protein
MTDLLGYEDFSEIVNKAQAIHMDSSDKVDELFRTWGFDPNVIADISIKAVRSQVEGKFPPDTELGITLMGCFVTGYLIGCMASQEVELRRQTSS